MDTKIKQQEIQSEINNLKIQSAKFEKWGMNVLKGLPLFIPLIIIFGVVGISTFLLINLFPIIIFIVILLFGYSAFLRQKQNLLFKELELLIKHQIEFPTT